jgi:probable addiction module antidote protein
MPRSRPYKVGLNERLKDPVYAVQYLNAARRESRDVELLALRDVVQAHKVSKIAKDAKLNRETLYRTLSSHGNPTMATLEGILKPLGVDWEYRPACPARGRVGTKRFANRRPLISTTHNAAPQSRHVPDMPQGQSAAGFGKCSTCADYSGTVSSSAPVRGETIPKVLQMPQTWDSTSPHLSQMHLASGSLKGIHKQRKKYG